jgi:ParB/RepB/Spo0J family partition protein
MSKKSLQEAPIDTLSVPFRSIFIPDRQIRSDEPEIENLAARLKSKGQLYPVLVARGAPNEKQEYTLLEGFRRMAAWVRNGWQNEREVLVRIVEASDPVSRIATNWEANMQREDFHPLDQAECVYNLVTGSYPVLKNEPPAEPLEKEAVAERLGLSVAQVTRLVKLHRNVDADVSIAARKANAPISLLFEISTISGEGESQEEIEEDRAKKQFKLLETWIEKQKALSELGRKRAVRSDKGKRKKGVASGGEGEDGEPSAVLTGGKRVKHATYAKDEGRSYSIDDYLAVFTAKHEALASSKSKEDREAAVRYKAMIDLLRFLTGQVKRLPDLNKSDFEALTAGEREEAEGAEVE